MPACFCSRPAPEGECAICGALYKNRSKTRYDVPKLACN